ncbi:MAG TPA: lysylphosphatidylglycerol synthase transmembrane domain-containing protein, partial [Longimicrobiales bacterium]|nr:lysylphosphatidylglycerol synthase transmembrane domain-containing protein [Longimicrobiales bacterium]
MGPHVRHAAGHLSGAPLKPWGAAGSRAFRIALLLLPLGVLGNIAYTLLGTDRAILDSVGTLPKGYLLAALGLTLVPWLTNGLRLLIWTRFLGLGVPIIDVVRMTLVIDLGSAVSPTAIGGEAFKWGLLVRHGVRPGAAAALALLPKLEDSIFFAVALPAAVYLTKAWRLPVIAASARVISENALLALVAVVVIVLVVRVMMRLMLLGHAGERVRAWVRRAWGRLRRRLRRFWREARAVLRVIRRNGKSRLALTVALTSVQWIARYSVISALALFLGVPFDPVLFWLLQYVVFTVMSFIPTPGAAGGAEVAFTAVYAT